MKEKILVTGGDGTLAKSCYKTFGCMTPTRSELDVTNYIQIEDYIRNHQLLEIIILAGAITSVQQCEDNRQEAYNVNVQGTVNFIHAIKALERNIKLIYISTACVFDGHVGDYDELDLPYPENYYGLTKTISEELIKYSGLKYLIIRTNFIGREKWKYPRAFTDRFGTYLFADQVAQKMVRLINTEEGIIHVAGWKKLSMYDLAKMTTPEILPMTIDDYHGAPLTMNMTLDSLREHRWDIDDKVVL